MRAGQSRGSPAKNSGGLSPPHYQRHQKPPAKLCGEMKFVGSGASLRAQCRAQEEQMTFGTVQREDTQHKYRGAFTLEEKVRGQGWSHEHGGLASVGQEASRW